VEGGQEHGRDPGELYTVEQAAKVLDRTPGRVRQLLRSGDLEGKHEGGDAGKPWRVYAWSATRTGTPRGADRVSSRRGRPPRARGRRENRRRGTRTCSGWMQDLQRELGRLEVRLELTAQAESTAREDLERERARIDEERRRADAEREKAEELRRELEAERSRGFWSRLFGG
jgi:hypothetical protein